MARGNIVELLKEQLDHLKKRDLHSSNLRDAERRTYVFTCTNPLCYMFIILSRLIDNVRLLGEKVGQAEQYHRMSLKHVRDCNLEFRNIDRQLNAMRPDLMRLQWDKDQCTRYNSNAVYSRGHCCI